MHKEVVPYVAECERLVEPEREPSLAEQIAALRSEISSMWSKLRHANECHEFLNTRMRQIESKLSSMQQGMLSTQELNVIRDILKGN